MTHKVETFRWNVLNAATSDNATPNAISVPITPTDDLPRFKGYRIESTRLRTWDYTTNAAYFVTICTYDRVPLLGDVVDGAMILNEAGRIVDEEWRRTADVRHDVLVDEYIVMPNHVHGILILTHEESWLQEAPKTSQRDVSTTRLVAGSLGAIVNQFKGACAKRIRAAGIGFGWQSRFYDHIIRDEKSLDTIRQYIADNPLKWKLEHDTPENLWM